MQIRTSLFIGLTGLTLLGCDRAGPANEAAPARSGPATPHSEAGRASEASRAPGAARGSDARAGAPARADAATPAEGAESAKMVPLAEAAPADKAEIAPADEAEAMRDEERSWRRDRPQPAAGLLTAGRWSDRDDWDRWQNLLAPGSSYHGMLDSWRVSRLERVAVRLNGRSRVPADAEVVLEDGRGRRLWEARTDNQGRADLYLPARRSGQLMVRGPDGRVLASREVRAGEQHELRLREDVSVASALDLMFVVDTTGSMGDELSFLQSELVDIVGRVERGASQELRIRTSVNFYRDQGDDYVVRSFPFTADLDETLGHLRAEHAGGGGDYPEALDSALMDAVQDHRWSDSAVARVMFVITDAPPHPGFAVGHRLEEAASLAASKGIRVVPVASSGVDKPTEFMLRHLAVSTGGTYVFLTDHSGIGNAHLEPTVGPYVVEPLNDLLVDVIREYTEAGSLELVAAPAFASVQEPHHRGQPSRHAHVYGPRDEFDWSYLLLGLAVPALLGGLWWHRSRRSEAPIADARVARARRMLAELSSRARAPVSADARSWVTEMREVVDGMEELVRQEQAIDASMRVAGMQPGEEEDPTGMRASLRVEVARRRETIDAEINAGLLSVEAAYLHIIGGVGERSTTQASLDAARESLQTRIEIERELRLSR